eukprot:COSAG02_NODE_1162_length_14168_cov_10.478570_12_plen_87_part_00
MVVVVLLLLLLLVVLFTDPWLAQSRSNRGPGLLLPLAPARPRALSALVVCLAPASCSAAVSSSAACACCRVTASCAPPLLLESVHL